MNWKETPWLFANGRFKLRYNGGDFHFNGFLDYGDDMAPAVVFLDYYDGDNPVPVADCQLIARHIDDVTDEEISEWAGFNCSAEFCHDVRQMFCEDVERNLLSAVNLLFLLSIGVYPFPWPKDGSVIRREG